MRVGLIYDLYDDYPWRNGEPPDADAENEPIETVEAIEEAVRALGHRPVRVGPPGVLLDPAVRPEFDVAINIAEAAHSRNREGYAPTLLEMLGIPYLGSDALTLSTSLDKAATKDLAVAAGVKTPAYRVVRRADAIRLPLLDVPFPVIIKPRYEGSAKGIDRACKVRDEESLSEQVARIGTAYEQDVLVESFIEGAEYTVAIVDHDPERALPALQRAVDRETGIGLHALERRGSQPGRLEYELPGSLDRALERALQRDALTVFRKIECLDFARVDFRVDSHGTVWFLEINPLPTFAPDDTFSILAEIEGLDYSVFLSRIFERALARIAPTTT